MGRIVSMHDDPHRAVALLLPWFASGALEPEDRSTVEAHLVGCAACRAELAVERRLKAEVRALPVEAGEGWARLAARLEARHARRPQAWMGRTWRAWRAAPPWLGWAMAAQAGLIGALTLVVATPKPERVASPAPYHALSAPAAAVSGDIVVIFRPETPERALRAALRESGARLVDGPTASDAYVLSVPAPGRAAALARLRRRADIVLAEPINAGAAP